MANYSKLLLSESLNGRGILVAATASPGTLIHTSVAGATDFDEIWIYAVNVTGSSQKLTLQWGGTGAQDQIENTIAGENGLYQIAPGLLLNNGLLLRAFGQTANALIIYGWVNRITA
jgi:hypothetical protein